jgi:uroporphyrin-3 C-methyltransferase
LSISKKVGKMGRPINSKRDSRNHFQRAPINQRAPIKKTKPRIWIFKLIVLALLLLFLSSLGISYYQLFLSQNQTLKTLQLIEKSNHSLQKRIDIISHQMATLLGERDSLQTELNTVKTQKIAQITPTSPDMRLTLLETIHMVELANIQLAKEDQAGAFLWLSDALKKLQYMGDIRFTAIIKILISQINALKTMDIPSPLKTTLNRLRDVESHIDGLKTADEQLSASITALQTPGDSSEKTWQSLLKRGWKNLQRVVLVRRISQPIIPLSTIQRDLVRLNLHLTIIQAREALKGNQPKSYQSSLTRAIRWVKTYYSQTDLATQAVLRELKQLSELVIRREKPHLSITLNALRALFKETFSAELIKKSSPVDKTKTKLQSPDDITQNNKDENSENSFAKNIIKPTIIRTIPTESMLSTQLKIQTLTTTPSPNKD